MYLTWLCANTLVLAIKRLGWSAPGSCTRQYTVAPTAVSPTSAMPSPDRFAKCSRSSAARSTSLSFVKCLASAVQSSMLPLSLAKEGPVPGAFFLAPGSSGQDGASAPVRTRSYRLYLAFQSAEPAAAMARVRTRFEVIPFFRLIYPESAQTGKTGGRCQRRARWLMLSQQKEGERPCPSPLVSPSDATIRDRLADEAQSLLPHLAYVVLRGRRHARYLRCRLYEPALH